jgi:hypothetical protein
MRLPSLSFRQMLVGVALTALLLSLFRVSIWVANPSAGPTASQLRAGDEVVVYDDVRTNVSDQAVPDRKLILVAGTRCVVVNDPTGDEDDCYHDEARLVAIQVREGDHRDRTLTVSRGHLGVNLKWYDLRRGR